MDAQAFAYWLQGFAELNDTPPTAAQWKAIREHLQTVFRKVTPPLEKVGIPNINETLRWPPRLPADASRPWPSYTVECSASQILGSDDRGTVIAIC